MWWPLGHHGDEMIHLAVCVKRVGGSLSNPTASELLIKRNLDHKHPNLPTTGRWIGKAKLLFLGLCLSLYVSCSANRKAGAKTKIEKESCSHTQKDVHSFPEES